MAGSRLTGREAPPHARESSMFKRGTISPFRVFGDIRVTASGKSGKVDVTRELELFDKPRLAWLLHAIGLPTVEVLGHYVGKACRMTSTQQSCRLR